MNSIESLATFFGWCTVINLGIMLLFVLIMRVLDKDGFFFETSAKIFGISKEEVRTTHFRVFQQWRLALAVLNLVPYFALKAMS